MAKKLKQDSSKLLQALQFLSAVTKDVGEPYETHVHLQNHWATAFNPFIAAGHPIEEEIYTFPNNQKMIAALSKCGENFAITQLDNTRLAITSGKFKAMVPCLDPTMFQPPIPDNPIAEIDDKFKHALEVVTPIVSEEGYKVHLCSIYMNGYSVISTNGAIAFEYWHGLNLPPGIALPKAFQKALSKIQYKLVRFGFSQSSITAYFENGSWLRSQLMAEKWPIETMNKILNKECNLQPIPTDIWVALDAVKPFADEGIVYFNNQTLFAKNETASYEVADLPNGPVFSIKNLEMIKAHAKKVDFFAAGPGDASMLMFYGDNIRGVVMGMRGV
jgi:hypothetical protein